jgi:hypothetical protein
MRKPLLKNLGFLIGLSLFMNFSFGQIQGVTYTSKGIRKSVAEIIAYEQAHPTPANFVPSLRHENEGPRNKAQNPDALPSSKTTGVNAPNSVTATQTVNSNFLTIWGSYANVGGRESPYTPPDNNGDVGTTQIIATANCRMKIFTKPSATAAALTTPTTSSTTTLTSVLNINLNSFFANAARGITSISDPHVRFDRVTQRWFVVAIDVDHTTNAKGYDNYCCIGVSDGPTITASSQFTFFYFNRASTSGSTSDFYDYPTLGIDNTSLLIGGNMFANLGAFSGCNMWVVNKANLIAGTLTVSSFPHNTTSTGMYTPQGVQNDDPSYSESYFIGCSQSVYSRLVMRRVTYPGGVPTLSSDINIATSTTAQPLNPPSQGGTALDADDERPFAAMIKKNKIDGTYSLWTAQHTRMTAAGVGSGSGTRDGSLWYQMGTLTTTPTILQSGAIYDGSASTISMIYPCIAMSGQGHSVIGFSTTSSTKYPTSSVAGRYRTDASGTMQAYIDLTATTSSYNPGANRWGDYTQASVDPSDDQTIWVFTEYAPTTNAWGVRASQLVAPPPPTSFTLTPTPSCGTSTITMNGTSVNNSEFFDPGAGFTNRLQVAVTGPSAVTVTNVTFVSPTQITADISIPLGSLAGVYTVTVTNPDGQTTTNTFTLLSPCNPLPVTYISFTGKPVSNTVELNWKTASELNFRNYVVEKSADGSTFVNMAEVAPRGSVNTPAAYATVDRYPYPNYSYYRLKTMNVDGTFAYSEIVKVKTAQRNLSLTRLYPNPTTSIVNVEIVANSQQAVSVDIINAEGQKVMTQSIQLSMGINQKKLTLTNLAAGNYIVQFRDVQNNIIGSEKVIKQ